MKAKMQTGSVVISVLFLCMLLLQTSSSWAQRTSQRFKPFSAKIPGDVYAQPKVVEDIDGDGMKDLIFGAVDGHVHLFSSSGKEIVRPPYWPKLTGGPIMAEVNVVDLSKDGKPEILVSCLNGKVYCLDHTGQEKWVVNTRGTIRLCAPEVADVDGTGNLNVFIGSRSGIVSRIDKDGHVIWEYRMPSSVSAKVVTADINGDGLKEVICKDDGGKVSVLQLGGTEYDGWPQDTAPNLTWPFDVGVADINGDGLREIFTTTPEKQFLIWNHNGELRHEFSLTDAAHSAPRVADFNGNGKNEYIIGQADGTVLVCNEWGEPLPGWPFKTGHCIYHTPQVLDIDGDGKLDVVFTAWNPEGIAKDAGYVMALNRQGLPLKGYPKFIGKTLAPLTFADLNGDGFLEMIAMGGINYTADQVNVFLTEAQVQIKMAVMGSEITFK